MSEQIYSQVSAFVDDELVEAESELLIRRLCRDSDVSAKLERYGLIGEAMRGSAAGFDAGLANRISAALADDDTQDKSRSRKPASGTSFLKPLAGIAVAASVAAAALLVVAPQLENGTIDPEAPVAALADIAVSEPAAAYVVPAAKAQMPADTVLQLNRYLVQHSEYASRIQPSSVFSYRVVGYGDVAPAEDEPKEKEQETE